MTNIVWSSCVVIKTTVALKCLSVFAVVFTPSVVTANETTTLNISLLCVTYFFHSYLFFVSFSILKSQFFHLLWILFCLYTAACSGLPFALFSAPSSFSKIRSLCQSHFKSVSCFNLLNLFFFHSHATSFPFPFLPTPCWFFDAIFTARVSTQPCHPIFFLVYHLIFVSYPPRSFDVSLPLYPLLSHLLLLSFSCKKKKKIISLHSSSGKHQRGTGRKDKNRKLMLFISFFKECLLAKTRALPQLYLNTYRQMSTDTSPWPAGMETQWKTMP